MGMNCGERGKKTSKESHMVVSSLGLYIPHISNCSHRIQVKGKEDVVARGVQTVQNLGECRSRGHTIPSTVLEPHHLSALLLDKAHVFGTAL